MKIKECPRCESEVDSSQEFCGVCGIKLSDRYDRKLDGRESRLKEGYRKIVNKSIPLVFTLFLLASFIFMPGFFSFWPLRVESFLNNIPFLISLVLIGVLFVLWLFSEPKD